MNQGGTAHKAEVVRDPGSEARVRSNGGHPQHGGGQHSTAEPKWCAGVPAQSGDASTVQ